MYKFAREQKILEIGTVKVGGQIGENPTVIIPTIFYDGHAIVDDKNNTFDAAKAEALINEVETVGDETGNPCIFQVVGVTEELMPKCLDFVSEHTDRPFI
ncbi:MAG TPA: tetrahydromethanopterin S-methyltransferase subunit H, partial [Candidatus Methanoperedenaceae archaeon]|nr:tetrahydromethanopterin S-methyltransferase subunit H [Candidatus Methanoperedenaceae archaeon]